MAQRDQAMLARLADIGMAAAEVFAAELAESPKSGVEAVNTYIRLAQAIRRTIALRIHLRSDVATQGAALFPERKAREAGSAPPKPEPKGGDREGSDSQSIAAIIRSDLDLKPENLTRLARDTESLLDRPEDFSSFVARPLVEAVAQVCADLGVDPNLVPLTADGPRKSGKFAPPRPPRGQFALAEPHKPKPPWAAAFKPPAPHPSP